MALDNFTVNQNTGYVEQASGGMSVGQIDDIERRAKASVVTAQVEGARAEMAEKEAGGAKPAAPNEEAKVYGNLAVDALAPGLRIASSAIDFLSERHADREGARVTGDVARTRTADIASNPISIEQDIAGARRAPGAYRTPAQQQVYGTPAPQASTARTADAPARRDTRGEDLMASANIATMSLKDQHKEAVGTWDVKESKMASVQLAKKLTFGQELSNEQALQSVYVARQQYSATIGLANQMAPGMSLASGPSFKGSDILKMAQEEAELNRWRTQQS